MSIVELLEYNIVLDGDLTLFLKNLEIVIQKLQLKRKTVILCGDWNINFMEDSAKLQELKNLLLLYNLVNTSSSPTRITKKPFTLIYATVINKQAYECSSAVLDFGNSAHLVQIININVNRAKKKKRTCKE
jgi:hypothetical protein